MRDFFKETCLPHVLEIYMMNFCSLNYSNFSFHYLDFLHKKKSAQSGVCSLPRARRQHLLLRVRSAIAAIITRAESAGLLLISKGIFCNRLWRKHQFFFLPFELTCASSPRFRQGSLVGTLRQVSGFVFKNLHAHTHPFFVA